MIEWPDTEGGIRTLLRVDVDVQAVAGNRSFFGVPKGAREDSYPMTVVARAGGGSDTSDVPIDTALIQIDCWGQLNADGLPLKAGATALVNAVRSALEGMTDHVATPTCRLAGASVESVVWLPDPDSDRPRYVVTAEVTALLP